MSSIFVFVPLNKSKPHVTGSNGSDQVGLKVFVGCVMVRQLDGLKACQGSGKKATCYLHSQFLGWDLPARPEPQQIFQML